MKTKSFSVIISCAYFLLDQVSSRHTSYRDNDGGYGGRILHGDKAKPQDFPFAIRLILSPEVEDGTCGGSLISNHWILTAAHCIILFTCEDVGISPSTWVVGDAPKWYATKCIPHYSFKHTASNDIGMIKTKEDLVKDGGLKIIALPDPDAVFFPGTAATIVGWGLTELGTLPPWLLRGKTEVMSFDDCRKDVDFIPREALCVIGKPPLPDGACAGDSGGPIISQNVLAGVMIAVRKDLNNRCIIGSPVLGLAVVEYLTWIQTIMKSEWGLSTYYVTQF